jgi:hypothetical protein
MASNPNFKDEIELLESIVKSVHQKHQKKWLNELINSNDGQHWGAWFEIRLYDWLSKLGLTEIEPQDFNDRPDFKFAKDGSNIFIEAHAIINDKQERKEQRLEAHLNEILHHLKRPVIIRVEDYEPGELPVSEKIVDELNTWIVEQSKEKKFIYIDQHGNRVVLSIVMDSSNKTIFVVGPTKAQYINTDILKAPLKKKAKQNPAIRNSGQPYIIAVFIESSIFRAEDVVIALFGNQQVTIDINTNKIISSGIDMKGIHFYGRRIFHTSVSGTLVFKVQYDKNTNIRELVSWYIENPHAKIKINPDLFPHQGKFVVKKIKEKTFEMGWENGDE